uniref:Uncharacterized protein n=1 Tax=Branchiostoma floridae TaxID=7739 RepID=C3YEB9_BRAFL|eukprot:XP_002605417.1 hypothetical protein BRAFLDRAFT_74234 [Branchiostoma floridae]
MIWTTYFVVVFMILSAEYSVLSEAGFSGEIDDLLFQILMDSSFEPSSLLKMPDFSLGPFPPPPIPPPPPPTSVLKRLRPSGEVGPRPEIPEEPDGEHEVTPTSTPTTVTGVFKPKICYITVPDRATRAPGVCEGLLAYQVGRVTRVILVQRERGETEDLQGLLVARDSREYLACLVEGAKREIAGSPDLWVPGGLQGRRGCPENRGLTEWLDRTSYCGDGIVDDEAGEECDDGNQISTDSCIGCKRSFCGDGNRQAAIEECDMEDFGGLTCESYLPGSLGILLCNGRCKIDSSNCFYPRG